MASGRTPLPFLALGVLAFLLAVWAGLLRVGWPWPSPAAGLPAAHAVLMVSGFLGSLISLERAVGLRASWGYVAPVASVLGSFALLVPPVQFLAPVLLVFASGVGVALLVALLFVHRTPAVALMCAGMASWLVGNLVWAARFPALLAGDALLWWIGFPVLLIAGERVELARFRPTAISAGAALYGLAALFIVASVVGLVRPLPANHLAGAALAGIAVWLLLFDSARAQLGSAGLGRFIASALIPGYVWLGLGGVFLAAPPPLQGPYLNDAMLHAVFLGFVMSMILAHAPIVFPTLLGRPIPFRRAFYGPLALLNASLILRVAGDLAVAQGLREWAGLLNAVALVGFLVVTMGSARSVRSGPPAPA